MPPMPERRQPPEPARQSFLPKRRRLYASIVDGNKDDERSHEIADWLELIELGLEHSTIGRQVLQAQRGALQ